MFKENYWIFINWFVRYFLLLVLFFGSFLTPLMFVCLVIVTCILASIMYGVEHTIDYIAKGRDEAVAKWKKMAIDHPKELAEAKKYPNPYYLTADQYEEYQKWRNSLPEEVKYGTEIIFGGGGGIGLGVTARTKDGSIEKNLTDYSTW